MSIIDELRQYVAGEILKDPDLDIADDEPLISSGLVDSFSLVDLGLFVENTFGVRLHDSELNADTFDTLTALAALVATRRDA